MSNIPNRSNYGFLSCLFSLFKSRYNKNKKNFNLNYLKYDKLNRKNTINYCTGALEIKNKIQKKLLKRDKYCPFVDDPSAKHVCNLVYSVQSDSQKSKAAGTAALLLEILDLVTINYSSSGRIKDISWSKDSEEIFELNWEDEKLGKFFINKLLSYGPVVGLIYFISKNLNSKNIFKRIKIEEYLGYPSIDENMKKKEICNKNNCPNKNNFFTFPTGTTTLDSKVRSMKTLIFLTASTGIICPINYENKMLKNINLSPFIVDKWYFKNWKNVKTYPKEWVFNSKIFQNYISNNRVKIKKSIFYNNLIQKSSHRNLTNKCDLCEANIINLFYKFKGDVLKNRRYLLLRALSTSLKIKKYLNIKKLSDLTLNNSNFCVSKKLHYKSLIKDLDLANLCGLFLESRNDDKLAMAKISANEDAFGFPPPNIKRISEKILESKIFEKIY